MLVGAGFLARTTPETPDSGTDFAVDLAPLAPTVTTLPGPEIPAPPPELDDSRADVPVANGLLDDATVTEQPPEPVRLTIPDLDVDAEIRSVGYDAGQEAMEVPRDAATIGWYRYGPAPGAEGSAVLAAHVTWDGERGPFYALGDLGPGALIRVEFSDGTSTEFQAVSRATYAKPDLPSERLFARDVPPVLQLITCGGDRSANGRTYEDNVVVTAVVTDGSDPVSGLPG